MNSTRKQQERFCQTHTLHCGRILTSIRENEAEKGYEDEFGARYSVEIRVEKNNREIKIITRWIIEAGEDFPRLTSCYIQD